jgi:hypothetical protein
MERELTEQEWREIGAKLCASFDPNEVEFRAQSAGKSEEAGGRQRVLCYIDARAVQDRLDEAVGPGAWSFRYEPVVVGGGEVQLAKGILTIHGVTKEDIGDASSFAPSKGCVSDALKRAAAMWGVGRYLYDVEKEWVTVEKGGKIPDATLRTLRAKLPRPDGAPAPRQQPQREYKAEPPATQTAPAPTAEAEASAAVVLDVPLPPGETAFWKAPAIKDHQLELVQTLRDKGYKTRDVVAAYFNQLAKTDRLTMEDMVALVKGEARWMSRALHKLATDDLAKRADMKKSA